MITALITFNTANRQYEDFLDNFRFDPVTEERIRTDFAPFTVTDVDENEVTLNPYDIRDLRVGLTAQGYWKNNQNSAVVFMHVRDVVTLDEPEPNENPKRRLAMVEYLRTNYDGKYIVIGCWYEFGAEYITQDGQVIMHGQTITRATFDDADPPNQLTPEVVNETETYMLMPQYLGWMPDDPVLDENGDVIGSTPATSWKDVVVTLGTKPRWTGESETVTFNGEPVTYNGEVVTYG